MARLRTQQIGTVGLLVFLLHPDARSSENRCLFMVGFRSGGGLLGLSLLRSAAAMRTMSAVRFMRLELRIAWRGCGSALRTPNWHTESGGSLGYGRYSR